MDHFLHHHLHRRRATGYAPIPPLHPALNYHHHHHHHHNLLIPNRALVDPPAPDFHPPAVLSENPILIPPHIPLLLDRDLRHHHPLASPYHHPTANPNHRLENRSRGASRRDGAVLASSKRRAKNRKKAPRVLHDSLSLDYGGDDQRVQEFTPTPRKKQEKRKSAFLRIQPPKPNYSDGDGGIEHLKYAADFDVDSKPNSNSSRGKDKHGCLGNGKKKTEKGENSPVEVDISFESNTLVAKAVVVPSSSAIDSNTGMIGAASNKCLTSKRKKRRKALVSVNVSSGSQLGKLSTAAVNSSCSPCLAKDTSNSVSHNNASDSCSKATDNTHGKIRVAQSAKGIVSDEIANVQSGKTSSRAAKKKKIVKKVVKKVVKPNSNKSTSPSANILDGTVKADSVKIKQDSLEEKSTTVGKMSIPDCFQSLPREGNLLPEDKKGDVPFLSLGTRSGSQECITGKGSDIGIKRVGNISKPLSSDSSKEDKRTDPDDCLDVNNSALGLLSKPNTDKVTTSLNGSTSEVNHTDDDKKQSRQNEVFLSPRKDSNLGCPQSSADNLINTHLLNTRNSVSASGRVAGSGSNGLTDRSEENATVCDIGNDDIVGKACCQNDAPTLSQDAILEENPDIAIPVTSSGMDSCSSSAKPLTQDDPDCLQASVVKQGSDSELINSEESTTFPHADAVNVSRKQVSPSNVILSYDNCDIQSLQDSNITVGYGEGDTNENKRRKCRTLLKFSPSKMDDMSPDVESPVGLANDVDTTLSLWKDPSPSEIFDQSVQRLDFSSQSSIDGITTLNVKAGVSDAELYFGNNIDNDEIKVSRLYKRKKPDAAYLNFSQCPSQLSDATVATTSCAEIPISLSDKQAHKEDVAWLNLAIPSASPSVPYTEDIAKLSDNILVTESAESMDLNREAVSSENLELQLSRIPSHSVLKDLATPNVQFPMLEGEQKENASPSVTYTEDIAKVPANSLGSDSLESMDLNREIVTSENLELQHSSNASHSLLEDSATPNVQLPMLGGEHKVHATLIVPSNNETGIVVAENVRVEKIDLQYTEENCPIRDFGRRSPCVNMESCGINMKDDLLPLHNCMCLPFDGDVVISINSNDALIETMPDTFSALPSQGITSEVCDRRVSDCLEINNENICGDGRNLDGKSMIEQCPDLLAPKSPAECTGKIMKLDHVTGQNNLTMRKMMAQPSPVPSEVAIQQSNHSELNGTKKEPGCITPKTSKGHSFILLKSKTPASSTHMLKPRTWHRTGNNSPASLAGSKPSVNVPPKKSNIQNASYIRKGNSLLRKPTPVSASSQISVANQLLSLGLDESRKSISSESMFSATDRPNLLKTGVQNAPLKGQGLVPQPIDTKLECRSSPLVVNVSIGFCEGATDPKNVIETNDVPNSSEDVLKCSVTFENQIGISNDGASQVEVNDGNISSSNAKRTVYIKPKSNQLVATSNFCALSADDVTQTVCSDGYYKSGKNQLLRTSFVSHISPTVIMPNSNVNSDGLGACKAVCSRRFTKRRSQKVAGRLCKPLKTSLVWTLCRKSSPKNDIGSGNCQKFLSQLFPWKRSIFRRGLFQNPASNSNSSSLSAISKKLLLLRSRDAVYPRPTHGISLWKTNVLCVGGSSLKWSKSIYRRSTKVIEEATLAVAAVEREKREQKAVAYESSQAQNDEPLPSASIQSGLAAKEGYIPRYVRIGNGNQLIRYPKKRTRILANEKVRWSLHTARRRLARKQKYCQFFTRFGKCNKDDRKCPYIHDPSKIAVCTKFLNGLCSANCKLTHKVIPERMPDCSYFLQGLCTNRNCAYRHVNVNSEASICAEFLKGYCGDGNECRKKHSYVCPTFEATGSCMTGNKCKLHHPKKQGEGRKRKRSAHQNNSGGRYFGSIPIDISGAGMVVSQGQWQQSNDKGGEVADYIRFEVDEEVAECVDQSYEQAIMCDSDPWDSQLDDFNEHIRPALIMKNDFMAQPFSVQNYK